jgi:hypothetical protein
MSTTQAPEHARAPLFDDHHTLTSHLSLASPPDAWLRWTALRYQLPPDSPGLRVTVWRKLRARGALNLGQGLWAVPHDQRDRCDLAEVVDLVEAAGGTTTRTVVGTDDMSEVELHVRLWRACERVWDDLFAELDRLTIRAAGGGELAPDLVAALEAARERFGSLLAADLVGSDAAERAAHRLDALTRVHQADVADPLAPARSQLVLESSWRRDDGRARCVMVTRPIPSVRWCHAFAEFETAIYRPSNDRPPLQHGAFVLTCEPSDIDRGQQSIAARIHRFDSTLGA